MQYTKVMVRKRTIGVLTAFGLLAGGGVAPDASFAQIARPSRAAPQAGDPILDGGPAGPCNPALDSPDLAAGTDVEGHAVPSADLSGEKVPVPGHLAIPVRQGRGRAPAYVEADGDKLDALVNPPPACPQKPAARPTPHR
jgi:hypothetical protein